MPDGAPYQSIFSPGSNMCCSSIAPQLLWGWSNSCKQQKPRRCYEQKGATRVACLSVRRPVIGARMTTACCRRPVICTVDKFLSLVSQSSERQRKAHKASHKRLRESSETLSGQMLQKGLLWADGPWRSLYTTDSSGLCCSVNFSCILEGLTEVMSRTQLILTACMHQIAHVCHSPRNLEHQRVRHLCPQWCTKC